jgi:anaerobic selenocysteine-containing dehydrogenase
VLIRDELYDASFVSRRVSGFEDYSDEQGRVHEGYRSLVTRNFRTEEVSAITGVPVERITTLAKNFAANGTSVAVCGSDVMMARNGLLAGLAVHSLNVLMGSVSRPGTVRPGTVLFGDDPPLAPLAAPVLDDVARRGLESEPVGGPTPPFSGGIDAFRFARAAAESGNRSIEALLLYYANPLASSTHPELWRAALSNVPFIVSFSPFLDETTIHADVVLPDLLAYERWQDAPTPTSYPYPVWGVARPMVEPHAGGTHTGDALLMIAQGLGDSVAQSLPHENVEALLKTRAQGLFSARRGMTLGDEFESRHHRQMEERGWWLPEHSEFEPFWEQLIERGGWSDLFYDDTDPGRLSRTADGRIHLIPRALEDALEEQGLEQRPYVSVAADDSAATDEFPLRLIPYRLSTLSSGTLRLERWLAEQPTLFPNVLWDPWVELHPETGHELGFGDGTAVWVVSERGRYRARVKLLPGTARENVGAPYGLRHPNGELANPLQLLEGSMDPLTGLPSWFSTFVRLEPA